MTKRAKEATRYHRYKLVHGDMPTSSPINGILAMESGRRFQLG